MKRIIYILSLFFTTSYSIAQTTAIPDVNFEQELINLGLDIVLDGQVFTANIDTLTNLNIANKNISDLTGIEDFTALTSLICGFNQLTSLDITQNTSLTSLSCGFNQLTNLDVTQNTALNILSCDDNLITSLDVSQNTSLTLLGCSSNQLTSLDVSQNGLLASLYCYNNQLLSIDVSQNPMLNTLNCVVNQLSFLDVRNGNNSNVVLFDAGSNPNLNCIYVDDKNASYLTLPVWNKDASTYWANDSLDCQTIISVDEYYLEQEVLLYPNPTNNNITIKLDDVMLGKDVSIEIYDIIGQLSYSNIFKKQSNNELNINVAHLPKGIYLIQVQMDKQNYSAKFVKQ